MEWKLIDLARNITRLENEDAIELNGIVVNVDAFDSSIHWYPFLDAYHAGRRAALASISDVLVKGAKPLWILAAIRVPERYDYTVYSDFLEGVKSFCSEMSCKVMGGDTDVSQEGGFRATITAIGKSIRFVSRAGARPGDLVVSTGKFGASWAVYKTAVGGDACGIDALQAYLQQSVPNVDAWLEAVPYLSASIDNSDGLALSLHYLAERSKVGIVVDQVPLWEGIEKCRGGVAEALYYSGEEYQFIFAVPEESYKCVKRRLGNLYVIGRVIEGSGVRFSNGTPIYKRGWIGGL